jgi:single-strand DNA-binding protein
MINTTLLVGRLGKTPELKYFPSGSVVSKCTLAVERGKDETDWFDIEAWGKTAEILGNYGRSGDRIGIEGSLKLDSWEDKVTGRERCKPVISVSRVELLSSKKTADTEEE